MAPTGMYIEANGLEVYYEDYGEGEPLMLIHGGTATSQSWASHLPAFTEHFEVFTPDSRGHGRTDNPTGELGYRVMADDAGRLDRCAGSAEAARSGLQRRRADRPRARLALPRPGQSPGVGRHTVQVFRSVPRGRPVTPGDHQRAKRWIPRSWSGSSPSGSAYLREAHGHVYGPEYWKTYVKQIAALWLRPLRYTPEDIAAITDPVLLLVGDRDGVCTEESVELFRLLPNAELAVAPASDHGFIEAKAGLFDALALDFLMRHRNDSARVSK